MSSSCSGAARYDGRLSPDVSPPARRMRGRNHVPALALVDSPFQLLSLLEAVYAGVVERPPDALIRARTGSYERLLELGRDRLADVLPRPRSKAEYMRVLAARRELVIGDPFGGLF